MSSTKMLMQQFKQFIENGTNFDLTFSVLSSEIKSKLFFTYCMDRYGSQLSNYCTGYPKEKSNTFNMEITISHTL